MLLVSRGAEAALYALSLALAPQDGAYSMGIGWRGYLVQTILTTTAGLLLVLLSPNLRALSLRKRA